MEYEDLEEVFVDLEALNFNAKRIEYYRNQTSSYIPLYSEIWKYGEQRSRGRAVKNRDGRRAIDFESNSTSAAIFRKYGWNTIDSRFGAL